MRSTQAGERLLDARLCLFNVKEEHRAGTCFVRVGYHGAMKRNGTDVAIAATSSGFANPLRGQRRSYVKNLLNVGCHVLWIRVLANSSNLRKGKHYAKRRYNRASRSRTRNKSPSRPGSRPNGWAVCRRTGRKLSMSQLWSHNASRGWTAM